MNPTTKLLVALAATPLLASSLRGGIQDPEAQNPDAQHPEAQDASSGALRKVDGLDPWSSLQEQAAKAAEWELRLTDEDLDARERAYDELVRAAGLDAALQEMIQDWTQGGGELAWTARLAQRELGRASRGPLLGVRPFDPFQGRDPFAEMERQMESFFGGGLRGGLTPPRLRTFGGPGSSSGRSTSIQQGPDGVTVTIEETIDGESTKRTFTGKSLEEIQAANPDLDLDQGSPFEFRLDFGATPRDLDPFGRVRRVLPEGVRTDILGAYLAVASDQDVGLKVDRVMPGTIAAALPLNPGDVLLRMNGVRLIEVEDVKLGLEARGEDGEVIVQLVDAQGASHTRTWTPGE